MKLQTTVLACALALLSAFPALATDYWALFNLDGRTGYVTVQRFSNGTVVRIKVRRQGSLGLQLWSFNGKTQKQLLKDFGILKGEQIVEYELEQPCQLALVCGEIGGERGQGAGDSNEGEVNYIRFSDGSRYDVLIKQAKLDD